MIYRLYALCVVVIGMVCALPVEAAYTLRNGRLVNADEVAVYSAEEHFNRGVAAIDCEDWHEAAKQFRIVTENFPTKACGPDACFYLGISYYNLEELDFANDTFSQYLKCHNNPQFFEETIIYKFDIANRFKAGAKKRFFGTKQLPKWACGRALAIEIYDEVVAAVPCHELAAWSLYNKAQLLAEDYEFRESIDVYQQLIKRFPKHELAPESYLAISRTYIEQSLCELQNPDLLAFAQINLRRFKQDFPREPRVSCVEENVQALKEIYARALYETGLFYERKGTPRASIIYYKKTVEQFPDTAIAQLCQVALLDLTGSMVEVPCNENDGSKKNEAAEEDEDEDDELESVLSDDEVGSNAVPFSVPPESKEGE